MNYAYQRDDFNLRHVYLNDFNRKLSFWLISTILYYPLSFLFVRMNHLLGPLSTVESKSCTYIVFNLFKIIIIITIIINILVISISSMFVNISICIVCIRIIIFQTENVNLLHKI